MQELLGSISILFSWYLIGLHTLEWEALLLLSKEISFAAKHCLLTAHASTTAVTLLRGLSLDVPNHEGGEHGDTRQEKHDDTESGEEAEAGKSIEGGGATKEECDGISERCNGN